ncbi:MAG: Gfo/Idh/MocA family oxidoreductase [Candidatus Azobacteroides sp.]|nr:Gfo/Idh/MocA family oxidoreductase [Candidatus Azobacteroides sp.]
MKIHKGLLFIILFSMSICMTAGDSAPLKLGIAGLSHSHLWEVLSRLDRGDFEVVGVAEKDTTLWKNPTLRKHVNESLFFTDLEEMLDTTKPEAVIVYESIYDHLKVIEACAPRKIHVMVEKPLATTVEQAQKIAALASQYNIFVLTNYETTWYPANHKAYELIKKDNFIGKLSRMNIYDGHSGPVEIGCSKEFLAWLTDPVLNGGGAVIDFGCYGANLSTWLMDGQKPLTVYASLKQQKPAIYPKVDDDATIILTYPDVTTVIMASWNWPMNRKDMHVYGKDGYIYQDTPDGMRIFNHQQKEENTITESLPAPYNDPFYYFKAVVRGEIEVKPTDLSSLENNLIVVEILEAAIKSNQTGEVISLE